MVSKNLSLGLIIGGVVLLLIGVVEHFAVKVEMLPHLAIYLGVLAVIVAGVGIFGIVSQNKA